MRSSRVTQRLSAVSFFFQRVHESRSVLSVHFGYGLFLGNSKSSVPKWRWSRLLACYLEQTLIFKGTRISQSLIGIMLEKSLSLFCCRKFSCPDDLFRYPHKIGHIVLPSKRSVIHIHTHDHACTHEHTSCTHKHPTNHTRTHTNSKDKQPHTNAPTTASEL